MIKSMSTALLLCLAMGSTACADSGDTQTVVKVAQADIPTATITATYGFNAPDSAWRDLDPENTLYIDTDYGRIIVELYPEIAPKHVEQVKTLTRQKFYDYITFHRVIKGFMNQTGDPKGDGTGDSELDDLPPEFTFRRGNDMGFTVMDSRAVDANNPNAGEIGVGFYKALQLASQPSSQAILTKDGKVMAYGLHCKGVTSMARGPAPDSANSQFFLMRGTAPWLDHDYSIWGTTVWGHEHLTKFKIGDKGKDPNFVPDVMKKVQIAADVPEADRVNVQVLDTNSVSFKNFLKTQRKTSGDYPDICDIQVPTRLKP